MSQIVLMSTVSTQNYRKFRCPYLYPPTGHPRVSSQDGHPRPTTTGPIRVHVNDVIKSLTV